MKYLKTFEENEFLHHLVGDVIDMIILELDKYVIKYEDTDDNKTYMQLRKPEYKDIVITKLKELGIEGHYKMCGQGVFARPCIYVWNDSVVG